MTAIVVRRIEPVHWAQNRALRLEALENYPLGFLETLESARELADPAWQARAARGAAGGDSFHALAFAGELAIGNSVSFVSDEIAWLAAVYVSPAYRGTGLLARLVDACAGWVLEQGLSSIDLEVHEDNPRARTAYAHLGFVETGDTQPYPLPPGGSELRMRLTLAQAGPAVPPAVPLPVR